MVSSVSTPEIFEYPPKEHRANYQDSTVQQGTAKVDAKIMTNQENND